MRIVEKIFNCSGNLSRFKRSFSESKGKPSYKKKEPKKPPLKALGDKYTIDVLA